jgi:hypothetical protein
VIAGPVEIGNKGFEFKGSQVLRSQGCIHHVNAEKS